MGQRLSVCLVLILFVSMMPVEFSHSNSVDDNRDSLLTVSESEIALSDTIAFPEFEPWIEPSLFYRTDSKSEIVRVTVITHSIAQLHQWQLEHGQLESQADAGLGEFLEPTYPSDGVIDHRTFWLDSEILHKLSYVSGVIGILDAQNSPEPFDIIPFEKPKVEPNSVRSGKIHGANDSWQRGYTGDGIIVAVADTGVDFAHPDLEGTQARITDGGDYDGWPMMFDHNSMWHWLADGETYPATDTWYANTSSLDWDNDSNGVLDESGFNISGTPLSKSGIYHLGEHPDSTLRSQMGGDVPIIVIDSTVSGVYDLVIPDVNRNSNFSDDERMSMGNETSGLDEDGDGVRDVSAGLLYWISDGNNGVPYSETYASRHGYLNRIAGAGNLTLFMLDSGSHGTLCASAIAAQAQVSDGEVFGMAPNATIASIGNHYSGGHSLDGWRWIAEGNDGNPLTWDDQPNIGSFSFGYSSVDNSGADSYSLYLDWLTRVYNNQTHYAVAIGNGGHGYGTVKVPGAAQGIFSVGAFSSRTNGLWGQSAPWNNRGPNVVGRMDPDIVAVGWSATGDIPLNLRDDGNSATKTWGGTSLATPITAGLLAIVEQSWFENRGDYPDSQVFRDFVLSTADDRGYDPFVQGGGWFNASRATATLDGENGTWSATPSQWMSGTFQGQHRNANINTISQGESQTVDLQFSNAGQTDMFLDFIPERLYPVAHQVGQWLSVGNGSSNGENDTWDGYQESRPDLLIPIHISNNTTYQIPSETTLIRSRAVIEYAAFDDDLDTDSDERIEIIMYRWNDEDGDGLWVTDVDNDSMVDSEDWTESDELEAYATWYMHGPQAELRVGLPFEDMKDGIMLGISRNDVDPSGLDNVSIEWDWTAFKPRVDDWVSTTDNEGNPITRLLVPANSTVDSQFTISVPLDASSGLHQHGINIRSFEISSNGSLANKSHRDWRLPVVTNVPWSGPFDLFAKPLDGNVSNQTLYTESWISGAQRWNWRAESGDWRFLSVDWPEALDTGGVAIVDVNWDDNEWTDVDVLWLSQTPHGYAEEAPLDYGTNTFSIVERSVNNYAGSGRHDWGTYTDDSREVFVVPVSAGIHQMVLHTATHGVTTNDNALNISLGYVAAEQSSFHKVVTDWSEANGNESIYVVSTMPLPLESINSFGWTKPINFDNETAYQDDSSDKMSASWWHNFTVSDAAEISIQMDSYEDADLDLYVFRDSDEDGVFESGEEIKKSTSGSSSESITIDEPADGNYSIAVLGWSVSESVQFWIDVEIVAGDSLNITNSSSLNQSEISKIWPNGSATLAGDVPEGALELNVDYQMPESEGVWEGFVEVNIEGGVNLRLPFTYELVDINPEIEFLTPENLTQTNDVLPISLHAKDTGSGFSLANLSWSGVDNNTTVPNPDSIDAILWNLSAVEVPISEFLEGNSSRLFREVWVNSTLPTNEQWHDYTADIADLSRRHASDWLSIKYDTTAPILLVSDIPVITNDEILVVEIQTEWDAEFRYNGEVVETTPAGTTSIQISLDESQELNWNTPFTNPISGYLVGGNNTFSFSVEDPAGNAFNRSFEVILDTTKPEIISSYFHSDNPDYGFQNWSWSGPSLNVTNSSLSFEVTPDIQSICIELISNSGEFVIEQCKFGSSVVVTQQDLGIAFTTELYSPFILELGNISDGEYNFDVELIDWANNSDQYSYPLVLDRTLPTVEWDITPSDDQNFSDHRLGLSWLASEDVHLQFSHNGIIVKEWNSSYGGAFYNLSESGNHLICIEAWDSTEVQNNSNYYFKCRQFSLSPSLYTSQVFAEWDGSVVGSQTVQLVFQRGPGQWAEIRHVLDGKNASESPPTFLFEPGLSFIVVELELNEGENEFKLDIGALDHTETYWLQVIRDTITPQLSLLEVANRTTNLEPERVIYGVCEYGAHVSISTEISSASFVCDASENFTVVLGVPSSQGGHWINATSKDLGGNLNQYGIEVQYQEWLDWAIDDAKVGGPTLYQGSLILCIITLILGFTGWKIRKIRRKNVEESVELDDDGKDWLENLIEESSTSDSRLPRVPLPEEEELRAWARGERDVRSWRDNVPDEDSIDLE